MTDSPSLPAVPITVLIADDDPSVRSMLELTLRMSTDFDVVAIAHDATEAGKLASRQQPDLAILDVSMPGGGGVAAARSIRLSSAHTRILAYSGSGESEALVEMLRAGAIGYVLKGDEHGGLEESLYHAARGEFVVSGKVVRPVVEELVQRVIREGEHADRAAEIRSRTQAAIRGEGLRMAAQPIVDLETGRVIGGEALARFDEPVAGGPATWFAEAWDVGLGLELELATARLALATVAPALDPGYVGLNLSPETILSHDFLELLPELPVDRTVLEVTEHAAVSDYGAFQLPVKHLREAGGRLAVDDVGAGFASLRHILELEADILKLDVQLVRDIHVDAKRRALAAGLVSFAKESGTQICAEGIEQREELEALRDLGVRYGQGYYLARPTVDLTSLPTRIDLDAQRG